MRKISMKRRSRQSKAENKDEDANEEVDVSNGDVNNKNASSKKRKNRSKVVEENGKSHEDLDSKKSDSESEDEPKKKRKSKKNEKSDSESEDESPKKKRKSGKTIEKSESEAEPSSETKTKKSSKPNEDTPEPESEEEPKKKLKTEKKGKKTPVKVKKDAKQTDEKEEDYEVESIVDDKKIRGVQQYKIRWKGYTSDQDTWEPVRTLNCPEILAKYKEAKAKAKARRDAELKDEKTEYEVDRILEVHFKRDGKREFLVSWKGYSANDNTWEPEENMECKDLIERFMSKVEDAKKIDQRTLRTYRMPTERFTLATAEGGRRLSKRYTQKQRIRYVDCE